ncbi:MAG: SCO family protein [Ralstonia sp.]|jgi:protein SCO1|uniref:SCO family protein n=2 Tax=Ralstonia pickettii TaxID=329 RepID=A0A2P4RMC8_RALPI|nr:MULTISPECIES: SCO family protein [Ralstonia]MBA4014848.1 SCO family protein [Ralstonia sp.]MBA4199443.1 SCO family protein [Ralstonia sp.]MBA4229942.1 SCO family protein [Ralstonia sp.]MBA4234596.1 SCO family protein [Ralstonia sp.]MBA4402036.1 SCO family protein [Ralstonia sp.]
MRDSREAHAGRRQQGPVSKAPGLWAAGAGCLVLSIAFVIALYCLTAGFKVWTLDDRRSMMSADRSLIAPPVELRDERGRSFVPWTPTSRDEHVYLVDFIYTRCTTVCAALGSEFFQLQQRVKTGALAGRVELLSVSIDPAHDDARSLGAYGNQQHADPAIWRIGAPLTTESKEALLRSLDVVAIPDGLGGYVHNGEIHLIDARGVVLGLYDYSAFDAALTAAQQVLR